MATKRSIDTVFFLQIALGLFFLVIGVLSFIDYNSVLGEMKRAFGGNDVVQILVSLTFLVCGLVLIAALLIPVKASTLQIAILAVFILWLILLVFNNFISVDFSKMDIIKAKGDLAEKEALVNILTWIKNISIDMVMLCSIWVIRVRRYL